MLIPRTQRQKTKRKNKDVKKKEKSQNAYNKPLSKKCVE